MTNKQPQSATDTKLRVMRLIDENPEMSQREIAQAVGVSLGGINYCIRALVEKGLVKVQNFRNHQNKLAYAYLLTPAGISEKSSLAARFLVRKIHDYEILRDEIASLQREVEAFNAPDKATENN